MGYSTHERQRLDLETWQDWFVQVADATVCYI